MIEVDMKRDGRTLDHRTLEEIRKMAVERVREGERPSAVIASYGFHRCVIYRWLKSARGRGKGLRALASRQATGRPKKLNPAQERQVFRWINGRNPMQFGFDFGLWTRQTVRKLIRREFGVDLSLASVGAMLARLGLTAQKPLQRAYQRDPEAIERWQRETYPALARRAKREKADIYFWDESGFRADAVHGKTWGIKGQTPVVQVPGQRQSVSAASAVSAKGAFWFATYKGALNGESFVELLKKLMRGRRKPLHLVLDGLPAHKKKGVKDYVAATEGKLTLHFLPGYAPDLNPDELVWSHAKRTGNARRPLQAGEKLDERVSAQLAEIGNNPGLVRSFFKHPSVAYITDV
ncbi:MAG: IS630 family transposase [Acidobacteriaceae bacterium]